MIDRYGNNVVVAWAPHEILWVEAAMTLPLEERNEAFGDICAMSGRSFGSVRAQAYHIAYKKRKAAAVEAEMAAHRIAVRPPAPPLAPSKIIVSRAQLMAGRSTYSPTTGMR